MRHFKQDLRVVELARRAQRDAEQATFRPGINISEPTRRTDGARSRRSYADLAYVDQPAAVGRSAWQA